MSKLVEFRTNLGKVAISPHDILYISQRQFDNDTPMIILKDNSITTFTLTESYETAVTRWYESLGFSEKEES